MIESDSQTELGLWPRLLAACWFAAAAFIPILFFLLLFARESTPSSGYSSTGLWFFIQYPVSLAAFFGFAIGVRILDFNRKRTPSRAMLRGIMVAICSYLAMPLINLVFGLLWRPVLVPEENFLKLVYWTLTIYGVGAVIVGWLIVFAGAVSGLSLFWVSGKRWLGQRLVAAPRVTTRKAFALIAAAGVILVAANVLLFYLPTFLLVSRRSLFRILDQLDPVVGSLQHALFVLR